MEKVGGAHDFIQGRLLLLLLLYMVGPAVIRVSPPLFAHNFTLWYDIARENTSRELAQMPFWSLGFETLS